RPVSCRWTRCPVAWPGALRAASPWHRRAPSCCEIILMFSCSRTVISHAGVAAVAGPLAAAARLLPLPAPARPSPSEHTWCEGRDALPVAGLAGLQCHGPLCTVSKDLTPGVEIVTAPAQPRQQAAPASRCAAGRGGLRRDQPIDLTMASSSPANEDRYSRRSRLSRATIAVYSSIRPCRS